MHGLPSLTAPPAPIAVNQRSQSGRPTITPAAATIPAVTATGAAIRSST